MDVGIRELRAGLSRYVEQVKQGEEIVVTDHGKPVARLVPMNGERKIDRLIREGVVIPARSRTGWRPERLIPVEGSVSEIVIEQRG
jgi:prevent-host-death family protein